MQNQIIWLKLYLGVLGLLFETKLTKWQNTLMSSCIRPPKLWCPNCLERLFFQTNRKFCGLYIKRWWALHLGCSKFVSTVSRKYQNVKQNRTRADISILSALIGIPFRIVNSSKWNKRCMGFNFQETLGYP